MQSSIVTWENSHEHGSLLSQQYQNRKVEFVDKLRWEIPHTNIMEADQYDRPDTVYVIVHQGDALLGNARLLKTSTSVHYGHHEFSYMVRDAHLGRLPGIDPDVSNYAPQDGGIWEMSRFQAINTKVSQAIFQAALKFLNDVGARETVSFTRSGFATYLTHLGLPSKEIGPRKIMAGKPYSVIRTDLS